MQKILRKQKNEYKVVKAKECFRPLPVPTEQDIQIYPEDYLKPKDYEQEVQNIILKRYEDINQKEIDKISIASTCQTNQVKEIKKKETKKQQKKHHPRPSREIRSIRDFSKMLTVSEIPDIPENISTSKKPSLIQKHESLQVDLKIEQNPILEKMTKSLKQRINQIQKTKTGRVYKQENSFLNVSDDYNISIFEIQETRVKGIKPRIHHDQSKLDKIQAFQPKITLKQDSDQMKEQLLRQYIEAKVPKEQGKFFKDLLNLAILESGDIELFEDLKLPTTNEPLDPQKFQALSTNNYLMYLSAGVLTNKAMFGISRSIKDKLEMDIVAQFNMKQLKMVDSLVVEILERIKFKDLCNGTNQRNYQKFQIFDNCYENYIDQCQRNMSLELPIFQKIQDKMLILRDYQINEGICQALKQGLKTDNQILNTIYIENCGINDFMAAEILEGANSLKYLKSLTFKNTELGIQSLNKIGQLFLKNFPFQLQELRLIKCKLSINFQNQLLDSLSDGTALLQTLVLVHIGMTKETMVKLALYLNGGPLGEKNNANLRHLDISNNFMPSSTSYKPILQSLSQGDMQLEYLSLENNIIYESSRIDNQELILTIKQILIVNENMADLNLNNTGLSEDIIYELLTQAKESKNLVAIHLSNNPGVSRLELKDKKIKDYAKTRFMKALGIIKHFVSCDEYPNILEEESTGQSNEILTSNHKEFVQARRILKQKQVLTQTDNKIAQTLGRDALQPLWNQALIFQRIIGYDDEIQTITNNTPSNWQMHTSDRSCCWVCDRHKYSILFWNQKIGKLKQVGVKNIYDVILFLRKRNKGKMFQIYRRNENFSYVKMIKDEIEEVKGYNDTSIDEDEDFEDDLEPPPRPVVYSSQSNWIGIPFYTLSEFCFLIDKNKTQSLQNLQFVDIINYEFASSAQKKKKNFNQDLYELLVFYKQSQNNFREVFHKNLRDREPQFINSSELCLFNMNLGAKDNARTGNTTFVIPQFLAAGVYSYFVEYDGEYLYHKSVIHYRKQIVPFIPPNQSNKKSFQKQNSVFSEFREDNAPKIRSCIQHDMKHLRLASIFGEAYQEAQQAVEVQYEELLFIYKCALTKSNSLLGIDHQTVKQFIILQCKINIDEDELQDLISICEKNYQEQSNKSVPQRDSSKPKNQLCRKEFIELLLRLSRILNENQSIKEGFSSILEHIKKYVDKIGSWQEFRVEQLWTKECQTLFMLNKEAINIVCMKYNVLNSGTKVILNYNSLLELFVDEDLCSKEILNQACVMSKSTEVIDFEGQGHLQKLQQYNFSEFLEIIARVADLLSKNTEKQNNSLTSKIEPILSKIIFGVEKDSHKMKLRRYALKKFDDVQSIILQQQQNAPEKSTEQSD